jgi:hypothetical protein
MTNLYTPTKLVYLPRTILIQYPPTKLVYLPRTILIQYLLLLVRTSSETLNYLLQDRNYTPRASVQIIMFEFKVMVQQISLKEITTLWWWWWWWIQMASHPVNEPSYDGIVILCWLSRSPNKTEHFDQVRNSNEHADHYNLAYSKAYHRN